LNSTSDNQTALSQLKEALRNCYKAFKILFAIAFVAFLLSGIHTVKQGHVAYIQRLGKWIDKEEKPGLRIAFPFFVDQIKHFDIKTTHTKVIDSFETPDYHDTSVASSKVLLTKDNNILHSKWSIAVNLENPLNKYAFSEEASVDKDLSFITHIFNSVCIEETSKMSIEEILFNVNLYQKAIFEALTHKMKTIKCGYKLTRVDLVKISFPEEVKYAFEEVQKQLAQNEENITQAKIFEKRLMQELLTAKNKKIENANTHAAKLLAKTKADAQNMSIILNNYSKEMIPSILKYKLHTILGTSLKENQDQTFVLQENSELRLNIAEDGAVDKIKREEIKRSQNEMNKN
jgi:regulator of protease activity HflC (stomatin/prohibitin superfamily)